MDRVEAVSKVASELYATEKAVDEAILHATTMVQSMMEGREALSLSAVAFAGSQAKLMETLTTLSAAREAIVATHAELQKDHRRMGWGTYAVGPIGKPADVDDGPMVPRKTGHLRVA